jgi:AAA domain
MTGPDNIRPVATSVRGKPCMCVFGNPGVGKTRLISTSKRPLILRPPTDHTDSIREGAAEEWVVKEHSDLWDTYEYLRTLKPEEVAWDWVWLDSISLYQDHDLDAIHADTIAGKPHRRDTPLDMSEWALESRETAQWLRHMVALAKDYQLFSFGFTAHAAELPLPPDDDLLLLPAIRGKNMPSKCCGYMNIVAYMEVKEGKRVLRTQSTERYYAKDQYDAWPDGRIIEPTMTKISNAIRASLPETAQRRVTRRRVRRAA